MRAATLFKPPPKMNVAEWAEAYRYLGRAVSPEAGKFRLDRLPYQREPMEAFTDETVGETVLMWAAQMGKTELLLNAVGYHIHMNPSPMLAVYPTLDTARKWSTKKLALMLRETPVLHGTVKDPRSRDSGNTVLSKDYAGGFLVIAGSNSAASLRQISCRVVLQDEIDSYEASAGTEGDPCLLADARASNFHDATLIKASTPTIKGASRIEKYFEDSDQRYWFCPCPHCSTFHRLEWSQGGRLRLQALPRGHRGRRPHQNDSARRVARDLSQPENARVSPLRPVSHHGKKAAVQNLPA